MRAWITLVENPLYGQVLAATQRVLGHDKIYGNEAEPFYGTDDPEQLIEIIHRDIEKLFATGTATLYRIINVPDEVIAQLHVGSFLGPLDNPEKHASWTTKWEEIEFSALHVYSVHDDIDNYFVIEAEVPLSAVDIPVTIAQNIALHWENEIALKRGHAIRLKSIHRAEQYGGEGEKMRPDLDGAEMIS